MNKILSNASRTSSSKAIFFAPIQGDLDEVENILSRTVANGRPGVTPLIQHLEKYRGKRLRPCLLLLTARACGEVNSAHHVLGAVVEMIHTATLVHDDVLDHADTRRHVKTVNALWGNQASILLGDYLFTHAFHLTSTLGDAKACKIIGESTNRVCEGELHQICQRGNFSLTESEYFEIIDAKTAELTSCCCRLGAIYSGEPDSVVESLARFGRYLGIAFQIADDLLDLIGHEHTTGKSLGTDIEQKKLTLPLIYLLHNSHAKISTEIRHILENGHPNKRAALQTYLKEHAAISYARAKAEAYVSLAQSELQSLPNSHFRELLFLIAAKALDRNS